MSDMELDQADNVTLSTENGKLSVTLAAHNLTSLYSWPDKGSPFALGRRVLAEHNYHFVRPKTAPPKRTLRQLICSLHARISPRDSNKLPNEELTRHIRSGDVLLRRLRRLLASRRRFIDFEPMTPLQEAIAQELAKDMGCQTRFYGARNDKRYMVAYRPGTEPNPLEVRAREMCQSNAGLDIFSVEEEECQLEPMSFRDNKLYWHQPEELKEERDSLSLGRKILEEFNRDWRPKAKEGEGNFDKENGEPKTA